MQSTQCSKLVIQHNGRLRREQLTSILDGADYPVDRHEFILKMMTNEDVGLCFSLPGTHDQEFLIPEALPANTPAHEAWLTGSLHFRFRYARLDRGLIPRFIVESHKNLDPEKPCWRTGGFFKVVGCSVLLRGDQKNQQVDLFVQGPEGMRRAALNVIVNDLLNVHQRNPESKPIALVPVPGEPEVEVGYEHRVKLERKRGKEYRFYPEGSENEYAVGDLLDGVRFEKPRKSRGTFNFHNSSVFIHSEGDFMSNETKTIASGGSQILGVAGAGGHVNANHSRQSMKAAPGEPPSSIDRDEFERDVGQILTMLVDAREELDEKYESTRAALRKLNQIELGHSETLALVQSRLHEVLSQEDKGVLRSLREASGAITTNLVSSGLWKFVVEPAIALGS